MRISVGLSTVACMVALKHQQAPLRMPSTTPQQKEAAQAGHVLIRLNLDCRRHLAVTVAYGVWLCAIAPFDR